MRALVVQRLREVGAKALGRAPLQSAPNIIYPHTRRTPGDPQYKQ